MSSGKGLTCRHIMEVYQIKLQIKFGSLMPYGFRKDFQTFTIFPSFVTMATRVSLGKFFLQILRKKTMIGLFLCSFIKIGWAVSEKTMFETKVNTQMDRQQAMT